jgi:hypothetical protein
MTIRDALSSWATVIAVCILIGTVVGLIVAFVPFEHKVTESYSIANVGGSRILPKCVYGPNMTVPVPGSIDFTWHTNDSMSADVTLVNVSSGFHDWFSGGVNGSGSVRLDAGNQYAFWFCTWYPQTLLVSLSLTYVTPLL